MGMGSGLAPGGTVGDFWRNVSQNTFFRVSTFPIALWIVRKGWRMSFNDVNANMEYDLIHPMCMPSSVCDPVGVFFFFFF